MARAASPGVEVALVTSRAGLDALEADWNALFARAGRSTQLFQTFNWCWHWSNHFLLPAQNGRARTALRIVTCRRDGRLALVWPLVLRRCVVGTELGWLGEPVSQYGDVLVEAGPGRAELICEAWRCISTDIRPDLVRLRKVRADAEVTPLLERLGTIRSDMQEAPFLDLAGAADFSAFLERYPAKPRRNRRRLLRRLEEQGPIEVETAAAGNDARFAAGIALAMKREWLASRGLLSPALSDPRTLAFFQDVAEDRVRPVGCTVSVMRFNGEPAGAQIVLECCGRLAVHLIAYNLKYEKSGVGVLHLERAIERAFEDGFDTVDMLAPKADYKMDWAHGTVAVTDHAVPLSLKGGAYARLYLGWARDRLKGAITLAPARLKAAIAAAAR
jgi:CelD/BcsL family acetyltransferase involved in cellulose biosynthesis